MFMMINQKIILREDISGSYNACQAILVIAKIMDTPIFLTQKVLKCSYRFAMLGRSIYTTIEINFDTDIKFERFRNKLRKYVG